MPTAAETLRHKKLTIIAYVAAAAAAGIGAFYFISWMSGAMTYRGFHAITMKTNASVCLVLCGVAVVFAIPEPAKNMSRVTAGLFASVALAIGAATLVEHLFGFDLRIDQLLAQEPVGALGISHPNRMGPPAAVSFTVCGGAILLLLPSRETALRKSQGGAIILCLIAVLCMVGYLFEVKGLFGAAKYTAIAWPTTIALLLLGIALLCARPSAGLMAPVTTDDAGGVAIRQLLLPSVIIPVTLGFLRVKGEASGLFESFYGTSLLIVSWIAIFSALIYQTGKRISAMAASEQKAVDERQRTQSLLLEAESLSHTGAWEWDLNTDTWTFSDEWLRIHGVRSRTMRPEELLPIAHPDDRAAVEEAFELLRKGERAYRIEHRIVRADTGEVRTVNAQGQFVTNGSGKVVRVYGFVQDITEMKMAEEELHLQRQLLESVVHHLPAGVLIARGSDLGVLLVNPAYAKLAPGKQMAGNTLEDIWSELPELAEVFRRVADTGEPHEVLDAPYLIRRGPGQPLEERHFTWSLFRVQLPGNQGYGILNTAWETTELNRSERALRESEAKLRSVIEHLAEGLIVVDPGGGPLYWNRKALELFRYAEQGDETAFFQSLVDTYQLFTLQEVEIPVEQWPTKRIMNGEEYHDYELVVRNRKRNWQRIYSFSGGMIHGDGPEPVMGLLTVRDITASKQAERALKESEELLRKVLDTLPVGVWIMDREGTVIKANRTAKEIWGGAKYVGVDEFGEYKGWWLESGEMISAEEWGGARAIRKGEASLHDLVEIETFDGKRKILQNSSVPILNEKGEITGAITVNLDLTASKLAEEALRASEKKFRAVFQQAAVGMGRVNFTDAKWIDVNDAFCRMLGYSREEMLATPWPEITHPEDVDLDLIPFRQMAAGELETYSVEKRFIHKEGRQIWARLTLSLVRDPQGAPDYEIAIIEDITDRKQAEEELRKAKDELEQRVLERTRELRRAYADLERETEERVAAVEDLRKNEQLLIQQSRLAAMGEMLGNIAHQWRQPLNVLGLLLQKVAIEHEIGALSQESLEKEVAKAMDLILHMSQTISDFQNFLHEGKEMKSFSINEAVATTISLLDATLKALSVELEIHQEEGVVASGHRNEFAQVVMNIITNARDALRERGVAAPKIVINIFREKERAVVTIADNAGGIPAAIIEKIFDPYFTTKGPDRGTGIGLFMSKNIIEKSMNGSLRVRNSGEGAEFRIEV